MPWLLQNKLYLDLLLKMTRQEAIEVQVVQMIRANLSLPTSLLRNILASTDETKTPFALSPPASHSAAALEGQLPLGCAAKLL
jgi:hypothetical protein